jgi:hypothetical protein
MSSFLIEILAVAALIILFLVKIFGKKANTVQPNPDPNYSPLDSIVTIDLSNDDSSDS